MLSHLEHIRHMSSSRRTILIVEDNAGVRRMLRSLFESENFSVLEADSEAQVFGHLARGGIALVTLDLALGAEDGLAVARAIRARSAVPIIMVTAKGDDVDRIVGLEIGADDYISKPFNIREVLARVRAVLRRSEHTNAPSAAPRSMRFAFDRFELKTAERQLLADGNEAIDLTSREFALLEAFVRHPAHVLSRATLLDLVGGIDADPLERSIDTLVGRLRRKIEKEPATPCLIKTVRGGGYVFSAKVRTL